MLGYVSTKCIQVAQVSTVCINSDFANLRSTVIERQSDLIIASTPGLY